MSVGIEQDLLQEVVVFVKHALGNAHMALEGGARSILMLHHCSKDEGRHERNGERIGHRLIVLLERVFIDVESQALIEVLEENAAHIVALADDDGILLAELLQIGKGRAEHRVSGDIAHARLLVEFLEVGLHRGDVADDALLRQEWYNLLKYRDGILQRDCIDEQLRTELAYLLVGGETLTVICEAHTTCITFEDCHFVVETQQVDEETAHLACAHY